MTNYLNKNFMEVTEEFKFVKIGALEKADMKKDFYTKQINTFVELLKANISTSINNFKDAHKEQILNGFISYMKCKFIADGMNLADQIILINNIEKIFVGYTKWLYSYGNQSDNFYDTLAEGIEKYMMSEESLNNKIEDYLVFTPDLAAPKTNNELAKTIDSLPVGKIINVDEKDLIEVKEETQLEKELNMSFEQAAEIFKNTSSKLETYINEIADLIKEIKPLDLLVKFGDFAKVIKDKNSALYQDLNAVIRTVFNNTLLDKEDTYEKLENIFDELLSGKEPSIDDLIDITDLKIDDYLTIISNVRDNNIPERISLIINNVFLSFFNDNTELLTKVKEMTEIIKTNLVDMIKSIVLADVSKSCTEEELNKVHTIEVVNSEKEAAMYSDSKIFTTINQQTQQTQQDPYQQINIDDIFMVQRMADEMYMNETENSNNGFMKVPPLKTEEKNDEVVIAPESNDSGLRIDLEPVK